MKLQTILTQLVLLGPILLTQSRNVILTQKGYAISTSQSGGLITNAPDGTITETSLPKGITGLHDVATDKTNQKLIFAISATSNRVCSYTLDTSAAAASNPLTLVGCPSTTVSTSPFMGLAVNGGTLVVSGGTGGVSVFTYNIQTGVINTTPVTRNNGSTGVIGYPDVMMVTPRVAAFSTDFTDNPRFGTDIVRINLNTGLLTQLRDFRVQDSLNFQFSISPANFPLVNALYRNGRNRFMYTANGSMTVQNPMENGVLQTLTGAPAGFRAVTVAVNKNRKAVIFGLWNGTISQVIVYNISNPKRPSAPRVQSVNRFLSGRITSISSDGMSIVMVGENGNNIVRCRITPQRRIRMCQSAAP